MFHFISFISIQPAIHVTLDTSKYNIVQHTVLSHLHSTMPFKKTILEKITYNAKKFIYKYR